MGRGAGWHRLPASFARPAPAPLAVSIDFPMPGKTHRRPGPGILSRARVFELLRGAITQRGVEPEPVVIVFDELFEVGAQVVDILILVGVDLLPLEGLDEALAEGVVVRIGGTAHA